MSASDEIWILGIHMTKFGKHFDQDVVDLGSEAVRGALTDAGVTMADIGILAAGNLMGPGNFGQNLQKQIGQTGIPVYNVSNACATGATALRTAIMAVKAGEVDMGLAVGVEKLAGAGLLTLPGGDSAPDNDGWCISLEPGEARVVRLQDGLEPWAVWYLPDARLLVSTYNDGCEPWLEASLAMEVGLEVTEGTQIEMDLNIAEGAVLSYGATSSWEEEEVIAGLSLVVSGFLSLAGDQLSFDLADLFGGLGDLGGGGEADPLGGLLGDISPQILDSRAQLLEDGAHPEGLYAVSLTLWE